MQIIILDGHTANPGDLSWKGLEKFGKLTVYDRTPSNEKEILKRIKNAEIVYTNKTPLSKYVIEKATNLKFISTLSTGYNIIDLEAAKARNIPVSNVPAYSTNAVAQFTMALLLEICNQVSHHNNAVKQGRWENSPDFCFWDYPLIDVMGKTMGIVGFGSIGQATAKIAEAMGMNVITYSRTEKESDIAKYVTLNELLSTSDVISLHCPLLPSTYGLINKDTIAKMKDGVIIINSSRGQIIVEQDLADALNCGKVYAAGLDVVSEEPINSNNPLLKAKNCIITPHIAWASKESRERLIGIAIANLKGFIGGKPINLVT